MSNHATWLEDSVNPDRMKFCVRKIVKELNKDKQKLNINSIAVTGFSGSVIGSVVSYITGLPLVLVRKKAKKNIQIIM